MNAPSFRRPDSADPSEVLVDTPVWSLALRRKSTDLNVREQHIVQLLTDLIRAARVQTMGVIRQELLSGISDPQRFKRIRDYLRDFQDAKIATGDYEEAAEMTNFCRSRGITGSTVDLLLCSSAKRRNWKIFTTDQDFKRYRDVLGVRLIEVV